MIYFDTSALVKRFIREKGSKTIQQIFNQKDILVTTAKVTYVEALAAFARRKREGYISEKDFNAICRILFREWKSYYIIELTNEVLEISRNLLIKYPLRSLDAIHLASAMILKNKLQSLSFACCDLRLLSVAQKEGFLIINPEEENE